jgi:hypothetical protein
MKVVLDDAPRDWFEREGSPGRPYHPIFADRQRED